MPARRSHAAAEMDTKVSRKSSLRYGLMVTAAAFGGTRLFAQAPASSVSPGAPPVVPDRGPQIESGLVKQFVIAGHSNLDKVKRCWPRNRRSSMPRGIGAAATSRQALGGASHMGRPDIARFLSKIMRGWTSLPRPCSAVSTSSRRPRRLSQTFARAGASQNSAHCPCGERRRRRGRRRNAISCHLRAETAMPGAREAAFATRLSSPLRGIIAAARLFL